MVAMTIRRQISMAEVVLAVCAYRIGSNPRRPFTSSFGLEPHPDYPIGAGSALSITFPLSISRVSDKCPG